MLSILFTIFIWVLQNLLWELLWELIKHSLKF